MRPGRTNETHSSKVSTICSTRPQATLQGVEAVEALLSATPDTPSYMIGISENKITRKPLLEAVAQVGRVHRCHPRAFQLTLGRLQPQTQAVAVAIEEKNFDKAMSFRDPEFAESLQAFKASSTLDDSLTLPAEKVNFE
jgi:6-phosphofructokinase 1